jgi:hypothetical protein
MPYPATPKTWVAGDVLTAAQLNAELRDALLAAFPLKVDAWTTWTPAVWQGGAVASTNVRSVYQRVGRLIVAQFRVTATAAGVAANKVTVTVPVAIASATGNLPAGSGVIFDTSTSTNYGGVWWVDSTTAVALVGDWSGASNWGATPNIALASGDSLAGMLMYEAAT